MPLHLPAGELLDTPPPGVDEAIAIAKVIQFLKVRGVLPFEVLLVSLGIRICQACSSTSSPHPCTILATVLPSYYPPAPT